MPNKTNYKFDKSVDSGPLPKDADEETQKTIQGERIRRQVASRIGPKPGKGSTKKSIMAQLKERRGKR